MYDPRADKIDKSKKGLIVEGVKLGELKKRGLNEEGVNNVNKLTESLKSEGITNQGVDSENTSDSTDVEPSSDIKIAQKTRTTTGDNILITSSGDTKVVISVQDKNGFKDVINDTKPGAEENTEKLYDITSFITSFTTNSEKITNLNYLNTVDGDKLSTLKTELSEGTTSDVNKSLSEVKSLESGIEDRNEEIKELEGENNKVKVVAYLLNNESGSKKTKEFTY
tara:strand:- start:235 stop:906 length:672 start_codon:yes stop_codon:yes gene_type:complete